MGSQKLVQNLIKLIVEALKIQVPERPNIQYSYEYADLDGNPGVYG